MGPQNAVDREFLYISSGGRAAGGVPKPPPRRPQRLPRGPKDVPRGAQDPPRGSQDIPKTLPKLPRLVFSFPDLPRAQIDQNGPKWPSQTMCFTMSGLNFWTTLRHFFFGGPHYDVLSTSGPTCGTYYAAASAIYGVKLIM